MTTRSELIGGVVVCRASDKSGITFYEYNYTTVVYEEENNVGRSSSNGESRRGKLFGGIIMNFETRQRVCTYSIQLFGRNSSSSL